MNLTISNVIKPFQINKNENMGKENMKIAGQVKTPEEAKEIASIVRLFVVENRIKQLVYQAKEEDTLIDKKNNDRNTKELTLQINNKKTLY